MLRVVVVAVDALAALKSISNSPSVQRTTLKTASSPARSLILASRHCPVAKYSSARFSSLLNNQAAGFLPHFEGLQ